MNWIYPWQQPLWQQLSHTRAAQRLPHALLFAGIAGTGKYHFAECVARALMCQSPQIDGRFCQTCHACRLVAGRAHPDVIWVEPEKENSAIKVDQIRAVTEFAQQTASQGVMRIALIHPADSMNANAANALLKTLEEPPSGALFILISSQPSRLPATILSRCQQMTFPRPQTKEALAWLEAQNIVSTLAQSVLTLANGAPLAALRLVNDEMLTVRKTLFETLYALSKKQSDPLKSAFGLQAHDALPLLDCMLSWVTDMKRLQVGGESGVNQDYANK